MTNQRLSWLEIVLFIIYFIQFLFLIGCFYGYLKYSIKEQVYQQQCHQRGGVVFKGDCIKVDRILIDH